MNDTYFLLSELGAICNTRKFVMNIYHQPYIDRLLTLQWVEAEGCACTPTQKFMETQNVLTLGNMEKIFLAGM